MKYFFYSKCQNFILSDWLHKLNLLYFSGNSLYTHLHLRRDKFSMSKLIVIAQQICQGNPVVKSELVTAKVIKKIEILVNKYNVGFNMKQLFIQGWGTCITAESCTRT